MADSETNNLVAIERIIIRAVGGGDNPTQYIRVPAIFRSKTVPGDVAVFKQAPGSSDVFIAIEKQIVIEGEE